MNTPSLYRTFAWVCILSLILTLGFAGGAGAQSGPGSGEPPAYPAAGPDAAPPAPDSTGPTPDAPIVSVLPAHNLTSIPAAVAVQRPDSKGTDFWLMFTANYTGAQALSLLLASDTNTSGTVSVPGLALSAPFSVNAGTVTSIALPLTVEARGVDVVQNLGIHVTSQAEVTVYGLNRQIYTTDAFLGLPTDILGTEYIVLGYSAGHGSEFGVVATQNDTFVTIIPTTAAGVHPAGVAYTVALNQGQTYQLLNTSDLSGTIITSDRPVAVFGGNKCTNVPQGYAACDYLVEDLPPTNTWGRSFVTVPLATRRNGDTFRFLASMDGTTMSVNGASVATLSRGQFHERMVAGMATITADKPILVAQYSNGSNYDGVTSDPFMMLITPYEQFLDGYTVTTPASGFAINYINIVAPAAAVGAITLDGSLIPPASFTPIGISGFSGAQVSVALGSHVLAGAQPFGVFVYGFDSYDSYGYPGGLSLTPVAVVTHLVLNPETATNPVGTQHCVAGVVTDQNNAPVAGVRMDFVVSGVNPTAGFGNTDPAGQAQFCYLGTRAGLDTITVRVGSLSDTATATWEAGTATGGLSATPTSVPANNVSASTITLSGAPVGHLVQLSTSLAGSTLSMVSGKVGGDGRFVATIRSSAAGDAEIRAQDLTSYTSFAASAKVRFTAVGGGPQPPPANSGPVIIAGVRAQHPLDARYLQGVPVSNRVDVTIDWKGSTPGRVDFILNDVVHSETIGGTSASHSFDMGQDLRPGGNNLHIVAVNAAGQTSSPKDYAPWSTPMPVWMIGLQQGGLGSLPSLASGNWSGKTGYEFGFHLPPYAFDIAAPGFGVPDGETKLSWDFTGKISIPLYCVGPFEGSLSAGAEKGFKFLGTKLEGKLTGTVRSEPIGLCVWEIPRGSGTLEVEATRNLYRKPVLVMVAYFNAAVGLVVEQTVVFLGIEGLVSKVLGEFYIDGKAKIQADSDIALRNASPYFEFSNLKVGGGLGIEGGYRYELPVAEIKAWAGADGMAQVARPGLITWPPIDNWNFDGITLTGEVGARIRAGWFEREAKGSVEWKYPPTASMMANGLHDLTVTDWRLIGHLSNEDDVTSHIAPLAGRAFALRSARDESPAISATSAITSVLVSNVYTYTEPSLAIRPATDDALLLWVHDDIAKPVGQAQEIHFSRWNGSAWSVPEGVTNDDKLDGAPRITWTSDGKGLAVWQRMNDTLSDTATWDTTTAKKIEIATASYDPSAGTWSPVALLTDNTALDMTPQLARNAGGGVLAAWRQNEAGLLSGTTTDTDRIVTAFYGNGWSTPATAVNGIPGLVDLAAGYGTGTATIAFTRYVAPTGVVTPTLQLFTTTWSGASWSAPIQRTDDSLGDTDPQVVYNTANQPLVVWLAGQELRLRNLITSATVNLTLPAEIGGIDEFRVVQDAEGNIGAVFTAQASRRDLFVAFYDRTYNVWGSPVRLTDDTASEGYPAPAIDVSGRLLMGYAATAITPVTHTTTVPDTGEVITYTVPTEGQTDLVTLSHTFVRNLTLSAGDLVVSDEHPVPGSSVVISATVHNTGDRALAGVVVGFYDGDPQDGGTLIALRSLPTPMAGGAAATLTVTYIVPATGGVHTLYAVADPANTIIEAIETDNPTHLVAFGPDLAIADAGVEYWGGNDVGLVTVVRNLGTTASPPTTLAYYRDTIAGTLAVIDALPPLAASQTFTVTTPWSYGSLAAGSHTLAAAVNPGQLDFSEVITTNNTAELTLDVLPDLSVSPLYLWAAPRPDGRVAITVSVANLGSVAALPSQVDIYVNDVFSDTARVTTRAVPALDSAGQATLVATWTPTSSGEHTIYAVVNSDRSIAEITWANNVASTSVEADELRILYLPLVLRGQ